MTIAIRRQRHGPFGAGSGEDATSALAGQSPAISCVSAGRIGFKKLIDNPCAPSPRRQLRHNPGRPPERRECQSRGGRSLAVGIAREPGGLHPCYSHRLACLKLLTACASASASSKSGQTAGSPRRPGTRPTTVSAMFRGIRDDPLSDRCAANLRSRRKVARVLPRGTRSFASARLRLFGCPQTPRRALFDGVSHPGLLSCLVGYT